MGGWETDLLILKTMGALRDYVKRLQSVSDDQIDKGILDVIKANEQKLIDLNEEQLTSGFDADGQPLKPYKNPKYANFKLRINPKGVTDLRLTGNFFKSFFVRDDNFPVTVFATDQKTQALQKKYGAIFNFTEQSKTQITEYRPIRDGVIGFFRKLLAVQ